MYQRSVDNLLPLGAIRLGALIAMPAHFVGIGGEVLAAETVMRSDRGRPVPT